MKHRKHFSLQVFVGKWKKVDIILDWCKKKKEKEKANYSQHNSGVLDGTATLLNKGRNHNDDKQKARSARLPRKEMGTCGPLHHVWAQRRVIRRWAHSQPAATSHADIDLSSPHRYYLIYTPKSSPRIFIKKYIRSRQMPFMLGSIPSNSSVGATDEGKRRRRGVKGRVAKTEISITAIVFAKEQRGCITKL